MKNRIRFAELRRLLLSLGFREAAEREYVAFWNKPSDIVFVFRPYRPTDPVTDYNLNEVQSMLDARGLMSTETFEDQFKKAPA
jgi:hypothetical protein